MGKFFLVRFIQCFGVAEPVDLGVKVLARQFGLSDRQVSGALTASVACGAMIFSSAPEGKGRPKRCYRLHDGFHKKLSQASARPTTHHEAAVGNLLIHESKKVYQVSEKTEERDEGVHLLADARRQRQPGRLSVVNRLLLSVLLCRADRLGVVSDLGSSELCKITGLSKERLRNRVQCLIDQELIRVYVPGATSSVLSAKMKSTYFLNLNHPELSVEGNATSVLVCAMSDLPSTRVRHAHQIYSDIVKLKRDPTAFENDQYKQILRFFEGQLLSFFRLLQVMLEKYATDMLSKHWSDLGQSVSSQWAHAQEWRELIRKDFRFPKLLPSVDGDHPKKIDEDQYAALIDDLYRRVYVLAEQIKKLLCQASEVSFGTMDFVIVPQLMVPGYCGVTLLTRPHNSDGWRGYLYVEPFTEPVPFRCESEIPIEYRYRYGLLPRPSSEMKVT